MNLKTKFSIRSFYFKLFFSISILSIIIVISTSIIFSSMYVNNISSEMEKTNLNSIENLNYDFTNIFDNIINLNISLRLYPEISTFLLSNGADNFVISKIYSFLRPATSLNPYIYSCILYNSSYTYPITTGSNGIDLSQFISPNVKRADLKTNLNIVYSKVDKNNDIGLKPFRTLSVLFVDSDITISNKFDNVVIINLDAANIEKLLLDKYNGSTFIVDDDSNIIFSNNQNKDLSKGQDEFVRKVISSNSQSGSYRIKIAGQSSLLSFTKNVASGLNIINITSYGFISKTVTNKLYNIIFICLIVMILYCIVAYFLSRIIYSPISRVTELFSKFLKNSPSSQKDELSMISNVFISTMDELRDLQKDNEDKNTMLKSDYLKVLLETKVLSNNIKEEQNNFNFNINFDNLICTLIKVDNYNVLDVNFKYLFEHTFCKSISSLLSNDFRYEAINLSNGEFALLLNNDNEFDIDYPKLLDVLEKVKLSAESSFQISLTVGIGNLINNIDEFNSSYNIAKEMVKYRFLFGGNMIFYKRMLEDTILEDISLNKEDEIIISNSIKLDNKENYVSTISVIMNLLKRCTYSNAISLLFQVMTLCIKTINELIKAEDSTYSLDFEEFNTLFSNLQTIDDANIWLIDLFDKYSQAYKGIVNSKNSKYEHMILKIKEYIEKNYSDSYLSLEKISDVTGYVPYYSSKIFKDITGLNINDYIRDVRISKAKELLATTAIKAKEIGEMTGFSNTSNFYLVFKKAVGSAPAVYRSSLKKSNL